MPNNPVQIILNSDDFRRLPDNPAGGSRKDFFDYSNQDFVKHKLSLLNYVENVRHYLVNSKFGPATYLKVQMREEGLAKSYRPIKRIFTPDRYPCVGASAIGTLFFRISLTHIDELIGRIDRAENTVSTKKSPSTNKKYKNPTIERSEVGAMESFSLLPTNEKRRFSTTEALRIFQDKRTVSGYQIELFEFPDQKYDPKDLSGISALYNSLETLLLSFGAGSRTYLLTNSINSQELELQLTTDSAQAIVENPNSPIARNVETIDRLANVDLSIERHERVMNLLQAHPLVREIRLPIRLQLSEANDDYTDQVRLTKQKELRVPDPNPRQVYPVVGIIDSGVARPLDSWIVNRYDYLDSADYDSEHGTLVATLAAVPRVVNDVSVIPEEHGCQIYDMPLFPSGNFTNIYRSGFNGFLDEVELAVQEAVNKSKVRIFNLSINTRSPVEYYKYSKFAVKIDEISDAYDVIIVNSVGNLDEAEFRSQWQNNSDMMIEYFATRTLSDTIYMPSESIRAVSVGALNPPGTDQISEAPTVYTLRGPGLQVGVKPDVATFGGAVSSGQSIKSGLYSITKSGNKVNVAGTSFAAPIIAKKLADLDTKTNGRLKVETLKAMLIHNCFLPKFLRKTKMKSLGRQFAGFGNPISTQKMFETDDHQITMVFESTLNLDGKKPVILRFPFEWPPCLNSNGACYGKVRMTLVYSPPINPKWGTEFVRVNLDAKLSQQQIETKKDGQPRYKNQVQSNVSNYRLGLGSNESALIKHGLKWWPCKQYETNFRSRGTSTQWKLEVSSITRAESKFPLAGIPFSVILTIEDYDEEKPVFRDMQKILQNRGAKTLPIQAIARFRQQH